LTETLNLNVLPNLDELGRIAAEVEAMGKREDWSPNLVFRANLVLEELLVNIIKYGQSDGINGFDITLTSEPDRLTIEVVDEGKPFDPVKDAPPPVLTGSLEDRPVGGLGLHLVRSLVDELSYKRERGKNHVALVARKDK
jgi:anti-sigma regulatory factor (Ser/Thr protein kinase)